MKIIDYNRDKALAYAKRYALGRNIAYYDFSSLSGDCTNFCSQCLYAGARQMNYTPTLGWYYRSSHDRAPAWTGVNPFYKFITENIVVNRIGLGLGPFGEESDIRALSLGDFIQLANDSTYYHNLIIVGFHGSTPLVASHSIDSYGKPLTSYDFKKARGIKILGVRV